MPKIGVSSCLLGQHVRYDGGHKHNRYITQTLGRHVELVPFCPEVGIGLTTPRPPIRLVEREHEIRAVGVEDESLDVTERLVAWGREKSADMGDLSGYIVKKDSPSCGMERVRVYTGGVPERKGQGVYARTIMQAWPSLPVEEEGRLNDAGLRENFIDRVFTYFRWQQMMRANVDAASLVAFHTAHKFLLLAHDEPVYRQLGQLIARAGSEDPKQLADHYLHLMMRGLARHATPAKHANVLMHILGFLKEDLDGADKQELLGLIDTYRNGFVPLVVPITLLNHHLRKNPKPWVEKQVYLEPHPAELMLRNHV